MKDDDCSTSSGSSQDIGRNENGGRSATEGTAAEILKPAQITTKSTRRDRFWSSQWTKSLYMDHHRLHYLRQWRNKISLFGL